MKNFFKSKKILIPTLVFVGTGALYFASIGIIGATKGIYGFANEKYENNLSLKINFGRDIIVRDGVGGPYSEKTEEVEPTYLGNYYVDEDVKFPNVGAKYFLVGDVDTKQIIFSRGENESVPLASLTKLMTAVVADEKIGLEKETVVSRRAVGIAGEQGNLRVGEKYSIEEILYPLLLESSNDAAELIAEYDDREVFLADMNTRADLLKMEQTNYEDASGLSSRNVSSANDLLTLVNYISKYRNFIFEITQEKSYRLGNKVWFSNSRFKNYKDYLGGKNGYISAAGKTNIALFNVKFDSGASEEEGQRKIAIILLNTTDIERDTKNILTFLQKNVRYE